jgi:putative phosphoribosyl transferase
MNAMNRMPMLEQPIQVPMGRAFLYGTFQSPEQATAVVLFAHGSGSGRHSPRNRFVADVLRKAGLATLLLDLLTPAEESEDARQSAYRFDVGFLTERVVTAADWLANSPLAAGMTIGCFGASTGAAAALMAAADRQDQIKAVVSRGGRPDLAGLALGRVHAPTLLLVGGMDQIVLSVNREALGRLGCVHRQLVVIPGATHLFEEPGALEKVAEQATHWLSRWLLNRVEESAGV